MRRDALKTAPKEEENKTKLNVNILRAIFEIKHGKYDDIRKQPQNIVPFSTPFFVFFFVELLEDENERKPS